MTYREQFDEALKCQTREEALAWMEKEICRYEREFGQKREEAESTIRSNLGYMAGYYDQETATKVYELFGATHPVFGHPDYWKNLSNVDCLKIGMAWATKNK